MISKSRLAIELSHLKVFDNPDELNEQYPTDSEIGSDVLWTAYMSGDIEGKIIADFGAGTGILGIGCLLLGAKHVYFIEKDISAVAILKQNLIGYDNFSIAHSDITSFNEKIDVVVMNPPFGTRDVHADQKFLLKSFGLSDCIYSFHKTGTAKYVSDLGKKNGYSVTRVDYNFPLKSTQRHHKKALHRIHVSSFIFKKSSAKNI